mmetsp:Transcript_40865/g.126609  ORF Transcript_40865/g.126609 Transcript_40865/m.126609 type:complete len:295 (-) Transcript_40865:818-1702(-)
MTCSMRLSSLSMRTLRSSTSSGRRMRACVRSSAKSTGCVEPETQASTSWLVVSCFASPWAMLLMPGAIIEPADAVGVRCVRRRLPWLIERSRLLMLSCTNFRRFVMSLMVAAFVPRNFSSTCMKEVKSRRRSAYRPSASTVSKMKSACSTRSLASTPTARRALHAAGFAAMPRNSILEMRLSPLRSTDSEMILRSLLLRRSMSIFSFSVAATRQATSQRMPMSMLIIVKVARTTKTMKIRPAYHFSPPSVSSMVPWSGMMPSTRSVYMALGTLSKWAPPTSDSLVSCTSAIAKT